MWLQVHVQNMYNLCMKWQVNQSPLNTRAGPQYASGWLRGAGCHCHQTLHSWSRSKWSSQESLAWCHCQQRLHRVFILDQDAAIHSWNSICTLTIMKCTSVLQVIFRYSDVVCFQVYHIGRKVVLWPKGRPGFAHCCGFRCDIVRATELPSSS